jgi:site-specific recombinase XerD
MRRKPKRRFPPEVLNPQEIAALMSTCSDRSPTGIRNRALLAVLYRSGLRINEALDLYPKDVDVCGGAGAIRVLHGKGDKSRTVGIDPGGIAMLQRWLQVRAMLGLNGVHPIFCTTSGVPLTDAYIRVMLPRLGRKAGVAKRVHAHGFRHTHAAELRAEGVDIGVISKQLGHSSISTTAKYLDHIAPWVVVEAMGRRQW